MKSYPVIFTQKFITLITDKEYSITNQDPRFADAVKLYSARKYEALRDLLDRPGAIARFTHGKVKCFDGAITIDGVTINGMLSDKILEFMRQGLPFEPLARCLDKLYNNVSPGVRTKLYSFLEHNHLGITDEGNIIAFKLVKADGSPFYNSGFFFETQPNGITKSTNKYRNGFEYTYPRNEIREGDTECGSVGLYVANKNYWNGNFTSENEYKGDGILYIVEIDPADVCNVAHSESSKMVVCKFKIIDEYKTIREEVVKPIVKRAKPAKYGTKPSGQKFYNVRGNGGKFAKKS